MCPPIGSQKKGLPGHPENFTTYSLSPSTPRTYLFYLFIPAPIDHNGTHLDFGNKHSNDHSLRDSLKSLLFTSRQTHSTRDMCHPKCTNRMPIIIGPMSVLTLEFRGPSNSLYGCGGWRVTVVLGQDFLYWSKRSPGWSLCEGSDTGKCSL